MKEKIIVTAALPYANGDIHIGHLLEYIQADIYSRFLKLQGKDALYICASDMHGTPIEINAQKAGIPPEKFVEKYWEEHQSDFARFFISFDNYYKTHSPENKGLSEFFFLELKKKGYIYLKSIKVVYCTSCNRTLPDRYVKGSCPKCGAHEQYGDVCEKCSSVLKGIDLINSHCIICGKEPVQKDSRHYFFKLSAFAGQLKKWTDSVQANIQPEVRHWLQEWFMKGLDDWCISRDKPYFGFEIPNSKKEAGEVKYFYVWLDAPIGYISSTMNYCRKKKKKWEDYWHKGKVHHIIGKDIAYFHFLFWPAMLLGMGIPLPSLTVHGFITVDGQKMSKSRGTFFTAKDFLALFPAEALRFYYASHLDRKVADIDVNFKELQAVANNVLIGNIGNFCYRVLTFAEKNYGSLKKAILKAPEKTFQEKIRHLADEIQKNYSTLDFKSAVKNILKIADLGNAYFQKAEPWKNKSSPETQNVVCICVNVVRNIAILSSPILPELSKKVFAALSMKKSEKTKPEKTKKPEKSGISWKDINFSWNGKIGKVEFLAEKIEDSSIQKTFSARSSAHSGHPLEPAFPVHMAVGEIAAVKDHPRADSLYLLAVDLGILGKKQVVAGLKKYFAPQQLLHQRAVFCVNLKPALLRGEKSEAMILVADDGKNISLLKAGESSNGESVYFEGDEYKNEYKKHAPLQKEITLDEFRKVEMIVKQGKVFFKGKKLKSSSQHDVLVEKVLDGAKIG